VRGRVVRAGAWAIPLGLAGLAASAQDAALAAPADTSTLIVLDERPESEKKGKSLSSMITSCNYGVRRIGDKNAPTRFALLRTELAAAAGAALDGKTLHVPRFDIFINYSIGLRRSTSAMYGGGLLSDALIEHGANCPREKMEGGWFEAAELTTRHPPVIIEMRVVVDGQTYDVRAVHSPDKVIDGKFLKPAEAPDLVAALRKAAQVLVTQLH
jgi:hypothetical protein